ncbi:MAG TPA: hypothetical protein VEY71_11090 [Chitinophagales bacterium]|nr:hypothetical protein [Chitinophagales bacterium]
MFPSFTQQTLPLKPLSLLFVLVTQLAAAQDIPVPVYFHGPDAVQTDTALWRRHKLRSATVTKAYAPPAVIAVNQSVRYQRTEP